jgi:uncharacterized protein DUF6644
MLPLAEWVGSRPITETLREIAWYGAMINVMHLLALSVFAGAILIVDMRFMGAGLSKEPIPKVVRDARPWLIASFAGLVFTGLLQLWLQPVKEYYSDLFWLKMKFMLVAIVYTFFIRPRLAQVDEARLKIWGKVLGLMSIVLWSGVAIPARLIGLVG